jgi:ubiquinone/menaquinone biosynthesis C-methylase UbiE
MSANFEKVSATYEPYSQEPEYVDANRAMLETLSLEDTTRVLDLACGTGLLSDLLLQIRPGLAINGVDLSSESLDIGRRLFAEQGILAADQAALDRSLESRESAILLEEGSADELRFDDDTFDLAMMGNAIHLMPDKPAFINGVHRVLKPDAPFVFNSVFFSGTFAEGTEKLYSEWMKEAFVLLMKKNTERIAAGQKPFARKRGLHGKAFDKGWMSPEEWQALLQNCGFRVVRTFKRPVAITRRGLQLVGAYGGLAEVLMSGYPVEVASECLQEASGIAFDKLGLNEVERYWLEIEAHKTG